MRRKRRSTALREASHPIPHRSHYALAVGAGAGGVLLLASGQPAGLGWGVLVLGLALLTNEVRKWADGHSGHVSDDEREPPMLPTTAGPDPAATSPAGAHALQRAAGTLQALALAPAGVDTLPVTMAHVEEALDRLSVSMEQTAHAVAQWSGEGGGVVAEEALPPEARALRWHLRRSAHALRVSRDACSESREWSRRMLAEHRRPVEGPALARSSGG